MRRKFGMAFLLSIIASVVIMVSPSLVWFREEMEVFGQSLGGLTVKGSELGELAELASWTGVSIFARGEYVVMLGAFALVLTAACFFVPLKKKLMASLVGIIAVLCLGVGLEPTLKLMGDSTMPGEGVYLLFVGAVVLLIGAFRLPSSVRVEASPEGLAPPVTQTVETAQETEPPEMPKVESEPVRVATPSPPSGGARPSEIMREPTPTMDEVALNRNRLIAVAVGLVILAIFSGVAFRLPEASTRIVGGLFVGSVIKIVIAGIMLGLLLSVRARLTSLITYYAHRLMKVEQFPNRAKVAGKIEGLSAELSNVVVIAISWPLVVQIVRRLVMIDREMNFGWILILVTLAFVGLLLYRLYRGYQLLEPVLAVVGKGRQEVSCPKCGTTNSVGAKFCVSCGAELQPMPVEEAKPISLHCPKCDAENSPDAKFCQKCGTPLSEDVKKRTGRSSSRDRGS